MYIAYSKCCALPPPPVAVLLTPCPAVIFILNGILKSYLPHTLTTTFPLQAALFNVASYKPFGCQVVWGAPGPQERRRWVPVPKANNMSLFEAPELVISLWLHLCRQCRHHIVAQRHQAWYPVSRPGQSESRGFHLVAPFWNVEARLGGKILHGWCHVLW